MYESSIKTGSHCIGKVFHEKVLFSMVQEAFILTITFLWIVYGIYNRKWDRVFPYPTYIPAPRPKESMNSIYFVRLFYSQRSPQFFIDTTRIRLQFFYTDRTTLDIECKPEILMNAMKYKNDSCCNFFIRSSIHIGQLDSVTISHNSVQGKVLVELVEVQRLDNDPKTKFLAEVGEEILPDGQNKRKKYLFERPRDIEPDMDARPANTITLFELVPIFIAMTQICSMLSLVSIQSLCTDYDNGGCSRFKLVGLGFAIGLVVFLVLVIALYFYISVIRKGLHNNLGLDSCNYLRIIVLILSIGVIIEISIEILSASISKKFNKINEGSNVLNCDQCYALTTVTSFFIFYIMFGIMAPLYIIYRARYENNLIVDEEQKKLKKNRITTEKLKRSMVHQEVQEDKVTTLPGINAGISAGNSKNTYIAASKNTTANSATSVGTITKGGSSATTTKQLTTGASKTLLPGNSMARSKGKTKLESEADGPDVGGYAAQMMKMNKVKSISQYALKKK